MEAEVIDHPKRLQMEAVLQTARASRCRVPLTLQEMSLEQTMLEIERALAYLEQNVAGLKKLPHIDAAGQISRWAVRLSHLSFEIK